MPPDVAAWPPRPRPTTPLAVLASGGLDSAILLGEAVRTYPAVTPIFVEVGSRWEPQERLYLERFLAAIACPSLKPLVVLSQPVDDLYGAHWSLTGHDVPDATSADDAVFLPGRNLLLLAKPLLWCHFNRVPELATAPLGSNPFPDATPEFYDGLAALVGRAVVGNLRVIRPYATLNLHKSDVLKRGVNLPLELTFSCIDPVGTMHCGRCNKCAERRAGFTDAHMIDPTPYSA